MSRPLLSVVPGGKTSVTTSVREANRTVHLLPPMRPVPPQQLSLGGLLCRTETLVSVGDYDLTYDDFLEVLQRHRISKILDSRKYPWFGHRGFPDDSVSFQKDMDRLGIVYECPRDILVEMDPDPRTGKPRFRKGRNEIWKIANREGKFTETAPEHVLLARYQETLLREKEGLELLRQRVAAGPLLLLGYSAFPPKKAEQDVLVDALRMAFPHFDFDLLVCPRDKQWFPWMDREDAVVPPPLPGPSASGDWISMRS